MKMEQLIELVESGDFHHATYRCLGSLWEGLWIYRKSADGFRGYDVVGSFPKGEEHDAQVYLSKKGHGTSLGSYGNG